MKPEKFSEQVAEPSSGGARVLAGKALAVSRDRPGKLARGIAAYSLALVIVAMAVMVRSLLNPVLGEALPFVTLFVALPLAAWYGGKGPALAALVAGAVAVVYFVFEPRYAFAIEDSALRIGLVFYTAGGLLLILMFDRMRAARERAEAQRNLLETTFASVGDGIVTTGADGLITRINSVAESLTGWRATDALRQPLERVLRITSGPTRAPFVDSTSGAERPGTPEARNDAVLISKDGHERAIEHKASVIRGGDGRVVATVRVIRDVEAQRRAEREQEHALNTLHALFASAPVGLAILDSEMRYRHVNARLAQMNGIPPHEHIGRTVAEIVPQLYAQAAPLFRRVLDTNQAIPDQVIEGAMSADAPGEKRAWQQGWFPIAGEGRQPAAVGLMVQEITGQRRAERALTGLAQRLMSLMDNTPLAVVEWDADFIITRWAGLAEKMFGWTASEVVGKRIDAFPLVYEDDKTKVEETVARLANPANRFVVSRNRNNTKAGAVVSCEWYNSVLHDDSGRMVAVLSLVLDVTERERIQHELRQSEQRFRQLAEAMPQIVWATDATGHNIYINEQWSQFTGRPVDEGVSRHWTRSVHPDDLPAVREHWQAAVRDAAPYTAEFRLLGKDGDYKWHIVRGVPMKNEAGEVTHWYGSTTEIDEPKRLAEALRDADRRKDEFLATLAHELRNPLAPVNNSLELMRRAGNDAGLMEQARSTMERQVAQMVRLIDDLMDVSRITRNKLELKTEPVELAAVLQQAVETCGPLTERAGHRLEILLPPAPIHLQGDRVRLAQVFGNLLTNACKYTEPGGRIWITAEMRGSEITVTVRDTGVGIPADMLPRVFELFTQVDRSLERAQGGLGIGLSLVKRLVEMHGGTVTADSEGPGRGSAFTVRLPVMAGHAVDEALPEATGQQVTTRARRILVVDDNADGAASLALLLRLAGHDTRTAEDGIAAVQSAADFRPEVILLDIGLPKLNGYEVCREIRAQRWGKEIVIVALTGWGQDEDRRRSFEAGFNAHMVKPVDHAALIELLA